MGQHSFTTLDDARELKRAEDHGISPAARSGKLHDLMDAAHQRGDNDLWEEIGHALVRAHNLDDLSSQVSDHFVESCPDEVFKRFISASPGVRFTRWRKRAQSLDA